MRSTSTDSPANVLIVDDTPANLQVLGGMLKEQGCIVRPAPSGKLAIRFAEADPPDIVLLDVMMPEMDGYEVCRRLKQIERLKNIPIIFISALRETIDKVKAFSAGGVDYVTKPFQFEEVEARVKTHLNIRRLQVRLESQNQQLNHLNKALRESQDALETELTSAAKYVVSLIPPPIREGPIQTEWFFAPSIQLGGDSLGYHWIDEANFAMYLLDVSGHGVGSALLSVSVLNTLRTQCLPDADFLRPDCVLAALNNHFRRRDHNGLYFTLWYGVFHRHDRRLRFASAGHPPPLLIEARQPATDLNAEGVPIGFFPKVEYGGTEVQLRRDAKIYVVSDGCYEIRKADGEDWTREEMTQYLVNLPSQDGSQLDALYRQAMTLQGGERLEDDFSILCATFP